ISTDVCDRFWSHQSPVIDLFDEVHSKTLINEWWRRKVATAVHSDQARNHSEVIQNQQRSPQRRMCPDPTHTVTCARLSRSAMILRGVPQFSRSNSDGETLRPSSSSILTINSTVLIESNTWDSYRGSSRFVRTSSVSATDSRSCNTFPGKSVDRKSVV